VYKGFLSVPGLSGNVSGFGEKWGVVDGVLWRFCGVWRCLAVFGVGEFSKMVCVMLVFCGQCGPILSYWSVFAL